MLDDLQQRLERTRWARSIAPAQPASDAGWDRGTSTGYLRELVSYWRIGYDWRREEARLNALPQLIARVEGEDIHVVMTSRRTSATPLLLLHGWPDSFYRYIKVIPTLCNLTGDPGGAFDVVVPSLPGFAFSSPLRYPPREQPIRHVAHLLWKLMTNVLGFDRFAVAGGDTGSVIAQILAIDYPESVIGIHLTDLGGYAASTAAGDPQALTKPERSYLEAWRKQRASDGAYALVQASQPRSIAVGLGDSPVGLASWIVDRFAAWSDGDLDDRFSKDDLLTSIMLYWVTRTTGSSLYPFHAEARSPSLGPAERVELPVGVAAFPADIGGLLPRRLAERTLNVERWTEMPRGGHLAALEEPELYARDVMAFFHGLRGRGPEPSA